MLYTFLKIAIRNSLRQKLYTSLNVFGLALGLAAALIIGIFANHELTYDQFHSTFLCESGSMCESREVMCESREVNT